MKSGQKSLVVRVHSIYETGYATQITLIRNDPMPNQELSVLMNKKWLILRQYSDNCFIIATEKKIFICDLSQSAEGDEQIKKIKFEV